MYCFRRSVKIKRVASPYIVFIVLKKITIKPALYNSFSKCLRVQKNGPNTWFKWKSVNCEHYSSVVTSGAKIRNRFKNMTIFIFRHHYIHILNLSYLIHLSLLRSNIITLRTYYCTYFFLSLLINCVFPENGSPS